MGYWITKTISGHGFIKVSTLFPNEAPRFYGDVRSLSWPILIFFGIRAIMAQLSIVL
jgi:hypothetical protein